MVRTCPNCLMIQIVAIDCLLFLTTAQVSILGGVYKKVVSDMSN